MPTYLDDLLVHARERVAAARADHAEQALRAAALDTEPPPGLRGALDRPGVAVIAEIKRASPSKGLLAAGLDAVTQAERYRAGAADAISVLTEPSRFAGSLEDLAQVSALGTPTLRKDFIVDPYQIWEARLAGASAVLLIVAALSDGQLAELATAAAEAGLDTLVEVHDESELERALTVGPRIVGVNARDLRTFELHRDAFARIRPRLPDGVLAVAESGIAGPEDVRRAAVQGADAVLVGETLVTSADPAGDVAALVAAGRTAEVRQ